MRPAHQFLKLAALVQPTYENWPRQNHRNRDGTDVQWPVSPADSLADNAADFAEAVLKDKPLFRREEGNWVEGGFRPYAPESNRFNPLARTQKYQPGFTPEYLPGGSRAFLSKLDTPDETAQRYERAVEESPWSPGHQNSGHYGVWEGPMPTTSAWDNIRRIVPRVEDHWANLTRANQRGHEKWMNRVDRIVGPRMREIFR